MDRPEDVQPNPWTGKVYVALTNNSERGTKSPLDEANPVTGNRYGHVIELTETAGHAGTSFAWNILLLCGDPAQVANTYFAGFPADMVSPISCPDNLAFDAAGQPLDRDRRRAEHDRLQRRPLQGAAHGRRTRPCAAVPRRAASGRDVRSGHPRLGGHGLRRGAASGRGRHLRAADVGVPRRLQVGARRPATSRPPRDHRWCRCIAPERSAADLLVTHRVVRGVLGHERLEHAGGHHDLAVLGLPELALDGRHLQQRDAGGVEPVLEPDVE